MNRTFLEVCAGTGGLSTGLIKAGFIPLMLNDNKDCCKTLKHNHKHVVISEGSFDKLNYDNYIGKVDLLAGGVPCQSWSSAGNRDGLDDPRGELIIKFLDLVELLKPKMFIVENVKGLISHNGGETLKYIIDYIKDKGSYSVQYAVLNSNDYDVPQKRERIIIIGISNRYNEILFKFPL